MKKSIAKNDKIVEEINRLKELQTRRKEIEKEEKKLKEGLKKIAIGAGISVEDDFEFVCGDDVLARVYLLPIRQFDSKRFKEEKGEDEYNLFTREVVQTQIEYK